MFLQPRASQAFTAATSSSPKRRRPATYSRSQTPELHPDEKVVQDDHFETDPLAICPGDWFMSLDLKDTYFHSRFTLASLCYRRYSGESENNGKSLF